MTTRKTQLQYRSVLLSSLLPLGALFAIALLPGQRMPEVAGALAFDLPQGSPRAPKAGQEPKLKPDLKPTVLPDQDSYAGWFAGLSHNIVPSPWGSFRDVVPNNVTTAYGTLSPSGAGTVTKPTGGALAINLAAPGNWSILLGDSGWTLDPQTDGNAQKVWVRSNVESSIGITLRAHVVVIRGNLVSQIGSPISFNLSPGAPTTLRFDVGTTDAELLTYQNPKLKVDCTSQPYRLGLVLEPNDPATKSPRADFTVTDLQFGTIAACCSTDRLRPQASPRSGGQTAVKVVKPAGCCDNATLPNQITVGKDGELTFNITLPEGVDEDFEPYAEIVDADAGDVSNVYPGADTTTTDWMDRTDCDNNVGGCTEQQINTIVSDNAEFPREEERAIGDAKVTDYLDKAERELEGKGKELAEEDDADGGMVNGKMPVMPDPPVGSNDSWVVEYRQQTPKGVGAWAFYPGADIVYVHGLKVNHLKDLFHARGNEESWTSIKKYDNVTKRSQLVTTEWNPSAPGNGPASGLNPEFYSGYFKLGATGYWKEGGRDFNGGKPNNEEGHIPLLLQGGANNTFYKDSFVQANSGGKGFVNRYLTVAYSCADDAKTGAQAILRQIADAIRFETGVVNPIKRSNGQPGYTGGFGSRGIVIVSHSTGGLVTNIAMQLGKRKPQWQADWVVDRVKLHVADSSAMSGSRIATAAIVAAFAADKGVESGLTALGLPSDAVINAINLFLSAAGLPGNFGNWASLAYKSVLLDLVPTVAQIRWGRYFANAALSGKLSFKGSGASYVPPTVMVAGGHPSQFAPFKYSWLLLGLDDGVVNMNSSSANPTPNLRWPSGFLGGAAQHFDMGLYLGSASIPLVKFPPNSGNLLNIKVVGNGLDHKKRAALYYLDMKDIFVPGPGLSTNIDKQLHLLGFFAAGPVYQLTPTGMRTKSYDSVAGKVYREGVLLRYPNMFNAISAAADHFDGTIGSEDATSWPHYQTTHRNQPTIKNETNGEETFTVGRHDQDVYHAYTPPALAGISDPIMSRPVLSGPLPQETRFRGLRLIIKVRKKVRAYWLVKREYTLLQGWDKMSKFDYVYWHYLGGGRTPNMNY